MDCVSGLISLLVETGTTEKPLQGGFFVFFGSSCFRSAALSKPYSLESRYRKKVGEEMKLLLVIGAVMLAISGGVFMYNLSLNKVFFESGSSGIVLIL